MAQKQITQRSAHIDDMNKVGKPRTSKVFRKKGNAAARTSSKGNGKKIR